MEGYIFLLDRAVNAELASPGWQGVNLAELRSPWRRGISPYIYGKLPALISLSLYFFFISQSLLSFFFVILSLSCYLYFSLFVPSLIIIFLLLIPWISASLFFLLFLLTCPFYFFLLFALLSTLSPLFIFLFWSTNRQICYIFYSISDMQMEFFFA